MHSAQTSQQGILHLALEGIFAIGDHDAVHLSGTINVVRQNDLFHRILTGCYGSVNGESRLRKGDDGSKRQQLDQQSFHT